MDHQVQDDIDVYAATCKRRVAECLDQPGGLESFLKGQESPVEALNMPHLEFYIVFLCQIDQRFGILNLGRDRFLDKHMSVVLDEKAGNFIVVQCGCRNRNGINFIDNFLVVLDIRHIVAGSHFLTSIFINVHDTYELRVFQLIQDACVEGAQMATKALW